MPFFLVKGTIHVIGYAPDEDSVRSEAENEAVGPSRPVRPST